MPIVKKQRLTASSEARPPSRTANATRMRNEKYEGEVRALLPHFIAARQAGLRDLRDVAAFLEANSIAPPRAARWSIKVVLRCIECMKRLGADPGGWHMPRQYSKWRKQARLLGAMQLSSSRNVGGGK